MPGVYMYISILSFASHFKPPPEDESRRPNKDLLPVAWLTAPGLSGEMMPC
jgi:hypothetical protein